MYSENYYKMFIQIDKGVSQLKFDKNIYRSYRNKIVNFAKDNKLLKENEV